MEDEIAVLRNKALSSIPSKVPRYKMDGLLGRQEYMSRRSERGRRLMSPDITRDVLGAFGVKPSTTRQYTRSKASRRSNNKSTRSSRSRSSESYSSYSSSSRSRSSSSSSGRSSYTRSSSYSVSSRSRSPMFAPRSPPPKSRRKVTRQDVMRRDKLLEHHPRKKPRYAEDLPPPVESYYYDSHSHRRMSKNVQYSHHPRKRPSERPEHVPYPKPRRPDHNDDYYPHSRHHTDRHKMPPPPPPPRSPSPYSHRLPPPRSHKDRPHHERPYDSGGKYYRNKPSRVEPAPRYRNRSGYSEGEHSSFSRRHPPSRSHHSSRRGNGRESHSSSSRNHETKERFIVVEESNFPNEPSRKSSGKHGRVDSPRGDREASPDSRQTDKPEVKSDLSEWEADSRQLTKVDPEPIDTELVSPDVKIMGDDSFAEELDYNEDMDNLDIHPSELLDVRVDEALEGDSSREKSQQSPSWSGEGSAKEDDDDSASHHSRSSSDIEDARPISSPLRVSPERSSDTREESWSGHGRVPVKQRLYLSKQKIEEKKRSAQYQGSRSSRSQSDLRPSLANRLGPPQSSRYGSQRGPRRQRDTPAKGSAMAIAEAYRKQKQKEAGKKVVLLRSQKEDKSGSDKGKETRKVNRL